MAFILTDNTENQLWKLLEPQRWLTKEQFKQSIKQAKREDRHLAEVLFEETEVPEGKLLEVLGQYYGLPTVTLRGRTISPYILNLIPKPVAEQHGVIVFKKIKDVVQVASTTPANDQVVEFIARKTGLKPEVFLTSPDDIREALKRYTGELQTEFSRIIEDSTNQALSVRDTAEKLAQFVPVITMVDSIIDRGLTSRASDIHLEPQTETLLVRFRIDGLLQNVVTLPKAIAPAIIARLKLLAGLKIDEHRLPQDGRLSYPFKERQVAIRVSAVPTLHGTKMVLRLLDRKEQEHSLSTLGLNQRDLAAIRRAMISPQGMILVTGPTGSGKTTTLYTVLNQLNREHINIATIEDPIEYGLDGVNQTQVNPTAGLTFANGLRALLRQDPNVIMVGEIRDSETADIAINAAMTGHLVLTTLHTNTAALSIQRLAEMGVPAYLSAPVIRLLIGQRLVRKICRHCAIRLPSTRKVLDKYRAQFDLSSVVAKLKHLELLTPEAELETMSFLSGRGCERCQETGYLGRVGIYEVMSLSDDMAHAIVADSSADNVHRQATGHGALSMAEDGLLKVFSGLTTFDEVLRVTRD